jgi:hypothetical protein
MARRDQCPGRYLSLAGFEVTIIGRFWVTAEVQGDRETVKVLGKNQECALQPIRRTRGTV